MTTEITIRPGMRVINIGCGLTQALRANGHEPPAEPVIVLKVFDWGFWVVNPKQGRVMTCEHWVAA
jgi:hypothetical protein